MSIHRLRRRWLLKVKVSYPCRKHWGLPYRTASQRHCQCCLPKWHCRYCQKHWRAPQLGLWGLCFLTYNLKLSIPNHSKFSFWRVHRGHEATWWRLQARWSVLCHGRASKPFTRKYRMWDSEKQLLRLLWAPYPAKNVRSFLNTPSMMAILPDPLMATSQLLVKAEPPTTTSPAPSTVRLLKVSGLTLQSKRPPQTSLWLSTRTPIAEFSWSRKTCRDEIVSNGERWMGD